MLRPELAKALAVASEWLEEQGRLRQQNGSPYVVDRSSKLRGNDEARARARVIAAHMRKIFGSFQSRTVATLINAALPLEGEDEISGKDVQYCCKELPAADDDGRVASHSTLGAFRI